jgi:hypothetical protein
MLSRMRLVGRLLGGGAAAVIATAVATTVTGCKSAADTGLPTAQAAEALVPCTAVGQTHCVRCDGWASGLCSQTEAAIVRYDIARHHVAAAGPEPAAPGSAYSKEACYECLMHSGCLDDGPPASDRGHECSDIADANGTAQCAQTLQCILSTGCARTAVSACYCGDAGMATCLDGKANGACAKTIAAGLVLQTSEAARITQSFTDPSKASGMATQILQCAHANKCASCFP